MAAGLQVFGPGGALWLDTNDLTTRIMGQLAFTSYAYPGDPIDGSGARYRIFGLPASANPWCFAVASNGTIVQARVTRESSTSARLTYAIGVGSTNNWPAGARIFIFYGWG